jgi:hypothetical protein
MKECKRQRWGLGPFLYPKIKIKKKNKKIITEHPQAART